MSRPYSSEPVRGDASAYRTVRLPDGRRCAARWNWSTKWAAPRWDVVTWSGPLPMVETVPALIEWDDVDSRSAANALLARGEPLDG